MNKIRHIFRLYSLGRSKIAIAHQIGVSRNTAKRYISVFIKSGLTYADITSMSDKELEDMFGKSPEPKLNDRAQILFEYLPHVDKQLKKPGMTRLILWEAYRKAQPEGFGFTQFCNYYNQWKVKVNPVMHLDHKAGDKVFVDFAGLKLSIVNPETGELRPVEVFIAILGASQLTYVQAVMSQQKEDFITACENALHYFEGAPAAIVPDNLKAAVTKSSRFEPTINETFADFADHYSIAVIPARAYRPRDKALVEGAVRIIYTRIYAPLNGQVYTSLVDLNQAIRELLEVHNNKPLKGRTYSRRLQFEEIERDTLTPLPALRYEFKKHSYATVMKNGHVCLSDDKHYYSVPYRYMGRKVKLTYSSSSVEIFSKYQRIAIHLRQYTPYSYTTNHDHLATNHRFVAEWAPERFLSWAADIHHDVQLYIFNVLERGQHPEQGYRSCMGILNLAKKVGPDRLVKACQRALGYGVYDYKTIQSILQKGIDLCESDILIDEPLMPEHGNIRGEDYYQ